MKKFKLIKEYPGSDHEGIIVSLKTPNGLYEGYQYNYYSKHVENQPEYWEEVIEKDYEILISRVVPQEILSVKRLSDGEVFTVGDLITGYSYEDARSIQTIKICRYTGIIKLEQEKGLTSLCAATKVKQPIYLTHNGKDIFIGDKVWYVNKENFYYDCILALPEVKFNSEIRAYFLTRVEAEDYIAKNKVLFTTADGVGIKKGDMIHEVFRTTKTISNTVVGCNRGLHDTFEVIFSTREAAEEYVNRNKPRLSIEDCYKILRQTFLYGNGFEKEIEKYVRKNNK